MVKSKSKLPFIDAATLPLESWLSKIIVERHKRKYRIEDSHFPSIGHRDEFLDSIRMRSELEVRNLLRLFLMHSGAYWNDQLIRETVKSKPAAELLELVDTSEFMRRLVEPPFEPWEGITWVLDLLPRSPSHALATLDAYFRGNAQFFSDGRLHGMSDAEAIIRARYLHWENPRDVLLTLQPEQFEFLIAALYRALGYEVLVTQRSRDGGVDVEATRAEPGARGRGCSSNVNSMRAPSVWRRIRELRGIVAGIGRRTRVRCHCKGGAYQAARAFASHNAMIELLEFGDLVNLMLNRSFGAR